MMRTRSLTALAAAVLTLALVAAPALAEVRVVKDRAGDGSSGTGPGPRIFGDIGKVRVKHGPENVRITVLPTKKGQFPDFYDFWVDTDPANPGPEYVGSVSLEVLPRAGVSAAADFGDLDGTSTCTVRTAQRPGQRRLKVTFPRSCFGTPDRLRVSTQTSMEYGSADWAPARRVFGPWVASS